MSLDQLLQELQLEKLQLMRDANAQSASSANARPSDVTRGRIEAMEMIIERIKHKKRAQVQIRLKLPFEVE